MPDQGSFNFDDPRGRRLSQRVITRGLRGVAECRCALEAHNPDDELWEFVGKMSDIEFDLNMEES